MNYEAMTEKQLVEALHKQIGYTASVDREYIIIELTARRTAEILEKRYVSTENAYNQGYEQGCEDEADLRDGDMQEMG